MACKLKFSIVYQIRQCFVKCYLFKNLDDQDDYEEETMQRQIKRQKFDINGNVYQTVNYNELTLMTNFTLF